MAPPVLYALTFEVSVTLFFAGEEEPSVRFVASRYAEDLEGYFKAPNVSPAPVYVGGTTRGPQLHRRSTVLRRINPKTGRPWREEDDQ